MNPVFECRELYVTARKRLIYLERICPQPSLRPSVEDDQAVAFIAIELSNIWAGFSRSLFFSSCQGARTVAGSRVAMTVDLRDRLDAEFFAAQTAGNRKAARGLIRPRDEPDWKQSSTLTRLLSGAGASNLTQVAAAVSIPGRVLQDLTTIRNFYGHRSEGTAQKARNKARFYGAAPDLHPTQLCLTIAPGRPQPVLSDWISETLRITDYATR